MLETLRKLSAQASDLDKSVRELTTVQVQRQSIRDDAQSIVDFYFRNVRDKILTGGVIEKNILLFDSMMHELLEISHKRSKVTVYRKHIKKVKKELLNIEKLGLSASSNNTIIKYEPVDDLIIGTLSNMLPSAAKSYEQAIKDLFSENRLSWRGPATDLRECLRETLDHLAPDKQVMGQSNFKLEKDRNTPTMKQKVAYILNQRGVTKSARKSPETATAAVDEIVGTFVRSVYTRSSVSTHTPTDKNEILRVRDWVRVALCELLVIRVGA